MQTEVKTNLRSLSHLVRKWIAALNQLWWGHPFSSALCAHEPSRDGILLLPLFPKGRRAPLSALAAKSPPGRGAGVGWLMGTEKLQRLDANRGHESAAAGRVSPLRAAFALTPIGAHGVPRPTFRFTEKTPAASNCHSFIKYHRNVLHRTLGFAVIGILASVLGLPFSAFGQTQDSAVLEDLTFTGEIKPDKARVVFEGDFNPRWTKADDEDLIYFTKSAATIHTSRERIDQSIELSTSVLQGVLEEVVLGVSGTGRITEVKSQGMKDWGLFNDAKGKRYLVIRLASAEQPVKEFSATVITEHLLETLPAKTTPISLAPENASLFSNSIHLEHTPEIELEILDFAGLSPVIYEQIDTPPTGEAGVDAVRPFLFRGSGTDYTLSVSVDESDPDVRRIVFDHFNLTGRLHEGIASFSLGGVVRVKNPKGGKLELLSGAVAMTDLGEMSEFRIEFENGTYFLVFDTNGDYPVQIQFDAAVMERDGWNQVEFGVVGSALRPVVLKGLAADTQIDFIDAAKPERSEENFVSFLPSNGKLRLTWQSAKPEIEGKLFYSVEGVLHTIVGPGLLRQANLLTVQVMQGETDRIVFELDGEGEITRVQGSNVLAWSIEQTADEPGRRLIISLNQPQKAGFPLQIFTQSPLDAFPLEIVPLRLTPQGAIRFGGHVRIANDGAVRLEVIRAQGLSQISPEHFPQTKTTGDILSVPDNAVFAFRFSDATFSMAIQADNIAPEVSVSELLIYHLGENDASIDAEFELEIREASLREFSIRIPSDYSISQLNAPFLSDYFVSNGADPSEANLRLVFSQPLSDRQIVQLRLEKNNVEFSDSWSLSRIEPGKAKSLRGHIAVLADPGLRLNPTLTRGVTEIAAAFFPKRIASIQSAYRIQENAWQVNVNVERVALAIQVDSFHLFSVGEGINYGSSILNYAIAGAPVSVLKFEVSSEFSNAEFIGKDIRNWKKTEEGYEVDLQTPVSGAYTLLVNFEQPFSGKGGTLSFDGVRPLDVQSERGYSTLISTYQFRVSPVAVSPELIQLEPQEIPAEYRLLFDAPVLAAYQFISRPFELRLELSPRAHGDTVPQVVDRAILNTRVSRDGEVLTTAQYFIKSKGHSHLRVVAPENSSLWSAEIRGSKVVPVTDNEANLIPLPQSNDPNEVIPLTLNLASKSQDPTSVTIAAPIVSAPVILTEWTVQPDEGQRLDYRGGTVAPMRLAPDNSGFAWISKVIKGSFGRDGQIQIAIALTLLVIAAWLWRWISKDGEFPLNAKNITGLTLGIFACGMAIFALTVLARQARIDVPTSPVGLAFDVPIQSSDSAISVSVKNESIEPSVFDLLSYGFLALVGLALWIYSRVTQSGLLRQLGMAGGWMFVLWSILRLPNGDAPFLVAVSAFVILQFVIPSVVGILRLPRGEKSNTSASVEGTASMLLGFLIFTQTAALSANAGSLPLNRVDESHVVPDRVVQSARVMDSFVLLSTQVEWTAVQGQSLDFLHESGVLTQIDLKDQPLKLVQTTENGQGVYRLTAIEDGRFEISIEYQTQVVSRNGVSGFFIPTGFGLVNKVDLFVEGQPVEFVSQDAVSIVPMGTEQENGSRAALVLKPMENAWVGWRPRRRDPRKEKAIFYADLTQLYVPTAGVVEGSHDVQIRPAQGEIDGLVFRVPQDFTITDVRSQQLAAWRFDPDNRRLQVHLVSPQPGAFQLQIISQVATSPLPFQQVVGLISVEGAAGQIGLAGVATGSEVQLNDVTANLFSAINLEDFPRSIIQNRSQDVGELTLRRAFQYAEPNATLELSASSVEPDVRVVSQETLSVSEDRTVLAARLSVDITRAGVFKLSFTVPSGMDVETLSSPALSHWTQLKVDDDRIVTMHLRGKTEGHQEFTVNLVGPGVVASDDWPAPRLILREASKQTGQLVLVPEQGMRFHVSNRDGVTPIDPQRAGIQQKGVLAFRILHNRWTLSFAVEQVAAWIQTSLLQDVTVREGQVKVVANLEYQIENTGLKSLLVRVPSEAQSVRFAGGDVADFVRQDPDDGTNSVWEIKLSRRVIGGYTLQAFYQLTAPDTSSGYQIRSVSARNVNLHRSYLTIRSGGRLNVSATNTPPELQRADWQMIPSSLRTGVVQSEPNLAFRALQPDYVFQLDVIRHDVAKLLPARVESATLTSIVSDAGAMLTEVRIQLYPGDKRLLHLKLPKDAQFWFAFANQRSVLPWSEEDEILLPIEENTIAGEPASLEFYFSSRTRLSGMRSQLYSLIGPEFDLPLENISWRVFVPERLEVKDSTGSLLLQEPSGDTRPTVLDLNSYLENEQMREREVTKEAETFLQLGNDYIVRGEQQQARQAFKSAWNLSQHDEAFNEDARVQLQNLRLQQALVGLNYRRNSITANQAEQTPQTAMPKLESGRDVQYTQQQAKQILEGSSGEENAILSRLAERLINQQESARTRAQAIRASLPEHGRLLTFTRSLQVESWAGMNIDLETRRVTSSSWASKILLLGGLLAWLFLMIFLARRTTQTVE